MTQAEFRAWRKRLAYTQARAAIELGYAKRQVESYERGEAPIPRVVELAMAELERREDLRMRQDHVAAYRK